MDDVYLLNNPFTFQAMEKHSAYCALMRLGIRVPETWLIPHKVPPQNPRFQPTAERYNAPFDLEAIGGHIGYPLFMKPFDGGQWVGVSRVGSPEELRARYDESGERMMHLQTALEDFDVFVRSLSIGAETMSMWFDPSRPMHDRYQVRHDFLTPELGEEVITISRLVNAFFRWEFNSCETIVKDGIAYPIDYANASPDVALTSLHYYFPWAIKALVRWSAFCAVTRREMLVNQNSRDYFVWGDRDDLSYEEKLAKYRELADAYFQVSAVRGVLREAPRAPRRARARVVHVARVRRRARLTRFARRSRRTSTTTSSRTTAGCSQPGHATTTRCRLARSLRRPSERRPRNGNHRDRGAQARQDHPARRRPHAHAVALRRPSAAARPAGGDRPHRARRRVADVRERPDRRLHDRGGGAHDRGVDGGRAGLGGRGDRVGCPGRVRPRQDRRPAERRGRRGRARRAARLAQARRRPPSHRRVRARVDERPRLVQSAAWIFGGLYIGLQLPLSAQYQETWDWNGSLTGDDRPGSWGGHAVDVVRYGAAGLTVVTWGSLKAMTWSFWDRYCDEAYCILSRDFLDGDRAPNGFDLAALRADLELVTA